MTNELPSRTAMVGQLLGARQGLTHHSGDALASRIVTTLDGVGFLGFLRAGLVSSRRSHACVDLVWIRIARRRLTVPCW
jgi:hypothetical protein